MPGKFACGVRMKNATASWSSTIQPTGSARAIHDRSAQPQHHLVEAGAGDRLVGVVPLRDVELCERWHAGNY